MPKQFLTSEIKHLQKKIKRENLKVRKTTQRDVEKIVNWSFENYQKRIEKEKLKKIKKPSN